MRPVGASRSPPSSNTASLRAQSHFSPTPCPAAAVRCSCGRSLRRCAEMLKGLLKPKPKPTAPGVGAAPGVAAPAAGAAGYGGASSSSSAAPAPPSPHATGMGAEHHKGVVDAAPKADVALPHAHAAGAHRRERRFVFATIGACFVSPHMRVKVKLGAAAGGHCSQNIRLYDHGSVALACRAQFATSLLSRPLAPALALRCFLSRSLNAHSSAHALSFLPHSSVRLARAPPPPAPLRPPSYPGGAASCGTRGRCS